MITNEQIVLNDWFIGRSTYGGRQLWSGEILLVLRSSDNNSYDCHYVVEIRPWEAMPGIPRMRKIVSLSEMGSWNLYVDQAAMEADAHRAHVEWLEHQRESRDRVKCIDPPSPF